MAEGSSTNGAHFCRENIKPKATQELNLKKALALVRATTACPGRSTSEKVQS